jgi:hypothetical protein
MRTPLALLPLLWMTWSLPAGAAADPPVIERFLIEGKLAEGEKALAEGLEARPDDSQARFSLGTVRFLRAVERMIQSFHRHGLRTSLLGNAIPFARLPIPDNLDPAPITYPDLRAILERWTVDLAAAEATLARVNDDHVKLPLHFGEIRLDLDGDGDGKADPEETLWKLYVQLNRAAANQVTAEASRDFLITFDRGDVAWLRGYCHLLMAFGDVYLAHDGKELFDHTAPLFFPRAETSFPFLRRIPGRPARGFEFDDIADAVAMVHLVRLPVNDPKRMRSVLEHLEAMLDLSRESWKFILAETDDDHEWVPNPKQKSVMPGGEVTTPMVDGWLAFLEEARSILKGKKLIPFWREAAGRGINLRRVFTEPRTMDLVLWVQGTGAAPYLEAGELTSIETWSRLQRVFRGEFIGFALWFN